MSEVETHRIAVTRSQSVVLDWRPTTQPARTALFVHGLGSNRRGEKASYFAERFNAQGWAFATVDLRGHGESDGDVRDLTMSGMLADLDATLRWLAARNMDGPPVLIGSSMGGAVIAWYALQHAREVGPLILLAPSLLFPAGVAALLGADAMQVWQHSGVRQWRSEWLDLEIGYGLVEDAAQYEPERLRQELQSPMLIMHGMRDEAVDWRASMAFTEGSDFRRDLLLLKDGDHRLTDYKSFLFDTLWAWLQRSFNDAHP